MTPRTPKPKPVEAWSRILGDSLWTYADGTPPLFRSKLIAELGGFIAIRVRIVPVTRKPRTKRKEKKK